MSRQPEGAFKDDLIAELLALYPGAIILKNDPRFCQGIPDHIMLYQDRWAAFEAKASSKSPFQPNQPYYLALLDNMSFAQVVYPERREDFLNALYASFRSRRTTRSVRS
jgi:hypothetical protein